MEFDPASFRDPEGRLFHWQGRIFRSLGSKGAGHFEAASRLGLIRELEEAGLAVRSRACSPGETAAFRLPVACPLVLEHEKIPFISYPYEWSFEMLRKAALTHLDIMLRLVGHGFILKDSTAYNYQFQGAECRLIDLASIEKRSVKEPWMGYTQFCRHFLNPLLLFSLLNVPPHAILRSSLEGVRVEDADALISPWKQWKAGVLLHLRAQSMLARRASGAVSERGLFEELPDQRNLILATARRLRGLIVRLRPPGLRTVWSDYEATQSYTRASHEAKREFLRQKIRELKPAQVFDLGANTGEYSLIASEKAGHVVAMDADPSVVDRLYLRIVENKTGNILPLLVDLSNPSPDQGFAGRERKSLFSRGRADLVIAFALLHHLRISGNIPLRAILEWFHSMGASHLLVEFIPKTDPMVHQLLKNRDDVYDDYTVETFAEGCARQFAIVEKRGLPESGREIFHLARK